MAGVAQHQPDHQPFGAVFGQQFGQRPGLLHRGDDGLFGEHAHAGVQPGADLVEVEFVGRADEEQVGPGLGQHVLDAVEPRDVTAQNVQKRRFRVEITDEFDLGHFAFQDRKNMGGAKPDPGGDDFHLGCLPFAI